MCCWQNTMKVCSLRSNIGYFFSLGIVDMTTFGSAYQIEFGGGVGDCQGHRGQTQRPVGSWGCWETSVRARRTQCRQLPHSRAAWECKVTAHKMCYQKKGSLQSRCQCKNKDRPREVQTSVFKWCRRECGDSKEGQERLERLYLQKDTVLCAGPRMLLCVQHNTGTTHPLVQHKGVEKPREAQYDASVRLAWYEPTKQ